MFPVLATSATTAVETTAPTPAVPSAATCRVTTPNASTPDAFSSCTVDDTVATCAAAAQGATALVLTGVAVVGSQVVAASVPNNVPTVITTVSPLTDGVYAFSIAYAVSDGGGANSGTWAGTVTVADGVYTLSSTHQTDGIIGGDGDMMAIDLGAGANFTVTATVQGNGGSATATVTLTKTPSVVRGRQYLLSPVDDSEPFAVEAANDASGALPLREPLPKAVGASSTVEGITLSVDVTTTTFVGPGLVEWKATVLGRSTRWLSPFRVAFRNETFRLTGTELVEMSAYSASRRPDDDDDYSRCIFAAWRRYVAPALEAKGIRLELVYSWTMLNAVHVAAVERYLADAFEGDATVREDKREAFVEALDAAIAGVEFWLTGDYDKPATSSPEATRPWEVTAIER